MHLDPNTPRIILPQSLVSNVFTQYKYVRSLNAEYSTNPTTFIHILLRYYYSTEPVSPADRRMLVADDYINLNNICSSFIWHENSQSNRRIPHEQVARTIS